MKTVEEYIEQWNEKVTELLISDASVEVCEKERLKFWKQALFDAWQQGMKDASGIVHDEPNLPGEMPDSFMEELSTKEKATVTIRSTVAVTMDNIKARILTAMNNRKEI